MKPAIYSILCLLFLGAIMWLGYTHRPWVETGRQKGDSPALYLSNAFLKIGLQKEGGAITSMQFGSREVNPLNWALETGEMPVNNRQGVPFRGHFICLNRWGSPTEEEIEAGMPHNGEANRNTWTVLGHRDDFIRMEVEAPLDQIHVSREITFLPGQACVRVREWYRNLSGRDRNFMLVQHATLGPPFINTESICSSNAGPGFLQIHSHPDPEEKSFYWPGPDSLDLRSCDPSEAYVSTHLVKDSLGWSTVASPVHGFLVGYLWDASRYPWLHIWQGIREDRLWAKGIEFGNTGLGDNFSLNDRYAMSTFGRRHAAQMQKQDSILCEYFLFAAGLPDGFQGVNQVTLKGQQIHIDFQRN